MDADGWKQCQWHTNGGQATTTHLDVEVLRIAEHSPDLLRLRLHVDLNFLDLSRLVRVAIGLLVGCAIDRRICIALAALGNAVRAKCRLHCSARSLKRRAG
jgi:hypothetical protein